VVTTIGHAQITNDCNQGATCLNNYLKYVESMSACDFESARRVLEGICRWR
jgi:hypothetical protein